MDLAKRVDDLLSRMTLGEKVGQLIGMYEGNFSGLASSPGGTQSIKDIQDAIREFKIGVSTPFGTGISSHNNVGVVARIANRLQKTAINETRLGIPLLIAIDALHGHANVEGGTVFPHNLGMAATWDPERVHQAARITATEMRATGATQNYAPMTNVARDPRWGRTYETYGESPHLVGELAAAEAAGLEYGSDGSGDPTEAVAATMKHFLDGSPVRGENAAPMDVSPTTLHRVFVPPFRRVVEEGVSAALVTNSAINGEPGHSSKQYLTTLLRGDLGFQGLIYSAWLGIGMLVEDHRTATTVSDAIRQAADAGVDVFSVGGPTYAGHLLEAVENGEISEDRIDESVRRVLEVKFRLGLFEHPFVDADRARRVLGRDEHRHAALECARHSMTLLKNEDVLPIDDSVDEVFVTGPNANSVDNLCGGWTVAQLDQEYGSTLVDGLTEVADGVDVRFEQGASIRDVTDLGPVRHGAERADLAVVALGENWYVHEFGPRDITGATGEFPTRSRLRLPEAQRRLLRTVTDTGVPTVLVLVSGRPVAVPDVVERADGVIMCYLPGLAGGRALAEILTGEVNPSGKLPITMPKSVGDLPSTHDRLPTPYPIGSDEHPSSYDPVFEFGHGLSYSDFEYRSLSVDSSGAKESGLIDVAVDVANRSERRGEEVVQVYARDLVSSRLTPVKELIAFDRVSLDPGETKRVELAVETHRLGVVRPDGSSVVEPGEFEVTVGELSKRFHIDD
ncbi:beta-glucosidase [Candidatus Halobonum tyrrellensis G22]|uniref:beta-glucosidase n=1 Tax=Candidatus Halobonum tyrrellensis G22 TaxID=1324957 RepID=V4H9V3_9EURY|nr:beta-glucosidase [Candidatus Halobonum tyrrellensis G22]